jgi:hypothetical protein
LLYHLFGLCWDIITYLLVLESPFYCHYNAKISLGLKGTNFIGVFFFGKMVEFAFVESCLPAVHSTEFVRG